MRFLLPKALFVAALFFLMLSAHAQNPQVANTGTPNGSDVLSTTDGTAGQFTVGGTGFRVGTVTALLRGGTSGNSIFARFYTDSGNTPTSLMGSGTTGDVSVSGVMDTTVTFNFNGGILLSANTTYWLGLTTLTGSANWNLSPSGFNTGGNGSVNNLYSFSGDNGATWDLGDSGSPYIFTINSTPAAGGAVSNAVPETGSSFAAVAFAGMLGGLAARARRRASKFAFSTFDF